MITDKRLSEIIEITGLKDNPYPFIKDCDIYVQPSYEEAHPLSIIEALILRKLIVSTATVGGKSIIHNGIDGVIANIDARSISEKISLMFQSKELKETIYANLSKIDYSKDNIRFQKEWKKLLEG